MRHVSAAPPSGEQYELRHGEQRAVVVEVGGGIRAYEATGRRILDGYPSERMASGGRGQPLLPWPNRLRDGRYEWDGQMLQLDLSEPAAANAIHGLLRWRNWSVGTQTPSSVTMSHTLHPSPGYPFALSLITYELDTSGLSVATRALNVGSSAAPYGVGFHPYLSPPGTALVDDCALRLPAATRLVADERGIPAVLRSGRGDGLRFSRRAPPRGSGPRHVLL